MRLTPAVIAAATAVVVALIELVPHLLPKSDHEVPIPPRLFHHPGWKRNSLMPISIYRIRMKVKCDGSFGMNSVFSSPQRHRGHREGLFKFKRFHHRDTEDTERNRIFFVLSVSVVDIGLGWILIR